jgi:cell volume regulation protein A
MTTTIIIIICCLFLTAYFFDLTASRTRIPSVILLLILGWVIKQLSLIFEIQIFNLSTILPILGTVGLILIVLEGSLELELNKSKIAVIRKSIINALIPIFLLGFLLAFLFQYIGNFTFKDGLLNAIPLCIISSAIAIPSVRKLSKSNSEFIIYESSFSDILGILIFNFIALNDIISTFSFLNFFFQLFLIIVVSLIATIGLSFLLSKSKHHIKFVPIILIVILIYSISKVYHLPALIFVLLFGLFLANIDEFKQFRWIKKFEPDILIQEVIKFKSIVSEAAFLIRTLFFLVFGYLIETYEILNINTMAWSFGIVIGIFIIRFILLKITKLPLAPLLYIAPRGLITILLFFSIIPSHSISIVNKSLIIQVIILTALIMMIGMIKGTKKATIVNLVEYIFNIKNKY